MSSKSSAGTSKRKAGTPPALKTPRDGDTTALGDLRDQRELLLDKLRSDDISPRDLATISAELRKVNATLSLMEGAQQKGGIDEDELCQRASVVRAMLEKTKHERDRLKLAIVQAAPTEADADPEAVEATG